MKQFILCLLFMATLNTHAQTIDPTLKVAGSARVSVTPDVGILNIRVAEIAPAMNKAIQNLAEKTTYYRNLLMKLGYTEKDIKTTSFSVSKNQVYRDNQMVDEGYVASQDIRLEFPYNQQRLGALLDELAKSKEAVDFRFDFKLSESLKTNVQKQLLEEAVADAKQKAQIIAAAAGVKLYGIKNINYGILNAMPVRPEMMYQKSIDMATGAASPSANFTPDDLTIEDTITIEWLIGEQ